MRSLQPSQPLSLLLFRTLCGITLITYLYLEGIYIYQIWAILLSALIWFSSFFRKTVTLLFLYSVFLLAVATVYALQYGAFPVVVISVAGIVYGALRYLASPSKLTVRRHLIVILLFSEALLLGSYLPLGYFAYATFATAIASVDLLSETPFITRKAVIWWKKLRRTAIVALLAAKPRR